MTIELRRCLGLLALLCLMVLGSIARAEAQLAIPACPSPATIGLGLIDGVPLVATGGPAAQYDWTLAAGTLPFGLPTGSAGFGRVVSSPVNCSTGLGTCRVMLVEFTDGTSSAGANFKFR